MLHLGECIKSPAVLEQLVHYKGEKPLLEFLYGLWFKSDSNFCESVWEAIETEMEMEAKTEDLVG